MKSRKWEEVSVDPKGAGHTYRLRVPGGWLYRTVTYRNPAAHLAAEDGRLARQCEALLQQGHRDLLEVERLYAAGQEIAAMTQTFVPRR